MGRKLHHRDDLTMRYIAKRNLWAPVAAQCGVTVSAVRLWKRVPAARVRDVERAIGRRRGLIRPDLYRYDQPPNP